MKKLGKKEVRKFLLEKIKENNKNSSCDFRAHFNKTSILIEAKGKLPGYGGNGNESKLNDFFLNHVFRLKFFFSYICPNFYESHKIEMAHFGGYESVSYTEYVNHSNHIKKHFNELELSKNMNHQQEQQVVRAIILELYDKVIPISAGKVYCDTSEGKIKYITALADRIANLQGYRDLMQKGVKQLNTKELADNFSLRKILYLYLPGYQNIFFGNPFAKEDLGQRGCKRFRENIREILSDFKQGAEIELWISDGKSLYKLLGNQMGYLSITPCSATYIEFFIYSFIHFTLFFSFL